MQSVRSFAQVFGLVAFLLILTASPALAERVVLDNVSYIHQVLDMDTSKFYVHNACGPTSAVMLLKTHHLQPEDFSQYLGHYVYSPYVGFTDKEGNTYNGHSIEGKGSGYAMDWDLSLGHIHSVPGAHGAIVFKESGDWLASLKYIQAHLQRHGLTVSKQETANRFQTIQQNINAGLPLIGHTYITRNGATYGHFLVITGYDTGANGNQQIVIVNDPYGNACATWNGSAWGEQIDYPLLGDCPASAHRINIDYVLTVHPVGIFSQFPGWYTAQNSDFTFNVSQKVLDVYNKFVSVLDLPHDNGGSIYIHELPNEPWNDPIYGQDFQNGMIVIPKPLHFPINLAKSRNYATIKA